MRKLKVALSASGWNDVRVRRELLSCDLIFTTQDSSRLRDGVLKEEGVHLDRIIQMGGTGYQLTPDVFKRWALPLLQSIVEGLDSRESSSLGWEDIEVVTYGDLRRLVNE